MVPMTLSEALTAYYNAAILRKGNVDDAIEALRHTDLASAARAKLDELDALDLHLGGHLMERDFALYMHRQALQKALR